MFWKSPKINEKKLDNIMDKLDPYYWFNIARVATILGGLLTVLGGVGLWQFGKVISIETNKEIQESKTEAAKANAEAEKAKAQAANANVESEQAKTQAAKANENAANANKEAANAKLKVEELKLDVAKANAEAEKAKLEREKITKRLNFIHSISAEITFIIPTLKSNDVKSYPTIHNHNLGKLTSLNLNGKNKLPLMFSPSTFSTQQINENNKRIIISFPTPTNPSSILGEKLDFFNQLHSLLLSCSEIFKNHSKNFNAQKPVKYNIKIHVNGVLAVNFDQEKVIKSDFLKTSLNTLSLDLRREFQKVPKILLGD